MKSVMLKWVCVFLMCSGVIAQDATNNVDTPAAPLTSTLITLRALTDSMTALRAQLAEQNRLAKSGENESANETAVKEAAALQARLDQAQRDFETIATGINPGNADPATNLTQFDVAAELTEMVQPLIREVKAATEQPRMIEQLRTQIASEEARLEEVKSAVANVEKTLASLGSTREGSAEATLKKHLQDTLEKWKYAEREARAAVEVVKHRLDDVLAKKKSVWETLSHATSSFFLTRGRNIFVAILAVVGSVVAMRAARRWLVRRSPWHVKTDGGLPFAARVFDVAWYGAAVFLAVLMALTVLYFAGDWLLLGLCLIALIGVVLGARTAIPKYYNQARLMLNFGEVREGERILYQGLPWMVKSLNMFSELRNPALRNGRLRVPLSQLAQSTSRPIEKDEPWFPCVEGDWVQLSDGTFGRVVCITHEFVQVVLLGGSRKTYPTAAFLAQNPQNHAAGFRVSTIIRLDHKHRDEATRSIPPALTKALHEGLLKDYKADLIKNIMTEFRAATTTALELEVLADFTGEMAGNFTNLQRKLQMLALDACNQHDWKLAAQVLPLEVAKV
jgi:predicted  nucleic acid-binding Zn-ribbon protein